MHIIWTNVPITRRKSYYLVTDPDENVLFRHRHFWPCIDFLDAEGVTQYEIAPSEHSGPEVSRIVVNSRRIVKWQN